MEKKIPAGEFKTHCLQIMDVVNRTHQSFIITKRNIPVAKIVPLKKTEESLFGSMKGTVLFEKDLISPTGELWDADLDTNP